jgi:hypothetical protein
MPKRPKQSTLPAVQEKRAKVIAPALGAILGNPQWRLTPPERMAGAQRPAPFVPPTKGKRRGR